MSVRLADANQPHRLVLTECLVILQDESRVFAWPFASTILCFLTHSFYPIQGALTTPKRKNEPSDPSVMFPRQLTEDERQAAIQQAFEEGRPVKPTHVNGSPRRDCDMIVQTIRSCQERYSQSELVRHSSFSAHAAEHEAVLAYAMDMATAMQNAMDEMVRIQTTAMATVPLTSLIPQDDRHAFSIICRKCVKLKEIQGAYKNCHTPRTLDEIKTPRPFLHTTDCQFSEMVQGELVARTKPVSGMLDACEALPDFEEPVDGDKRVLHSKQVSVRLAVEESLLAQLKALCQVDGHFGSSMLLASIYFSFFVGPNQENIGFEPQRTASRNTPIYNLVGQMSNYQLLGPFVPMICLFDDGRRDFFQALYVRDVAVAKCFLILSETGRELGNLFDEDRCPQKGSRCPPIRTTRLVFDIEFVLPEQMEMHDYRPPKELAMQTQQIIRTLTNDLEVLKLAPDKLPDPATVNDATERLNKELNILYGNWESIASYIQSQIRMLFIPTNIRIRDGKLICLDPVREIDLSKLKSGRIKDMFENLTKDPLTRSRAIETIELEGYVEAGQPASYLKEDFDGLKKEIMIQNMTELVVLVAPPCPAEGNNTKYSAHIIFPKMPRSAQELKVYIEKVKDNIKQSPQFSWISGDIVDSSIVNKRVTLRPPFAFKLTEGCENCQKIPKSRGPLKCTSSLGCFYSKGSVVRIKKTPHMSVVSDDPMSRRSQTHLPLFTISGTGEVTPWPEVDLECAQSRIEYAERVLEISSLCVFPADLSPMDGSYLTRADFEAKLNGTSDGRNRPVLKKSSAFINPYYASIMDENVINDVTTKRTKSAIGGSFSLQNFPPNVNEECKNEFFMWVEAAYKSINADEELGLRNSDWKNKFAGWSANLRPVCPTITDDRYCFRHVKIKKIVNVSSEKTVMFDVYFEGPVPCFNLTRYVMRKDSCGNELRKVRACPGACHSSYNWFNSYLRFVMYNRHDPNKENRRNQFVIYPMCPKEQLPHFPNSVYAHKIKNSTSEATCRSWSKYNARDGSLYFKCKSKTLPPKLLRSLFSSVGRATDGYEPKESFGADTVRHFASVAENVVRGAQHIHTKAPNPTVVAKSVTVRKEKRPAPCSASPTPHDSMDIVGQLKQLHSSMDDNSFDEAYRGLLNIFKIEPRSTKEGVGVLQRSVTEERDRLEAIGCEGEEEFVIKFFLKMLKKM